MYHSERVRALGPSICVHGRTYYFLSEGRKINFRVPYSSREILNILHCLTFGISGPLYEMQKYIWQLRTTKYIQCFPPTNSSI